MKALLVSLVCLVASACEVAPLPPSHDVEPRDSSAEVDSDARDATVEDTRTEVAPEVIEVAETLDVDETIDAVDSDLAPDVGDTSEVDEGPDTLPEVAEDTLESDSAPDVADVVADSDATPNDASADGSAEVADDTTPSDVSDATETSDTAPADITLSETSVACGTRIATFLTEPSPHVPTCSEVTYPTNPPTSGPHYPIWAAFKTYQNPVNPGFLVHSMEHGAVVIAYRCDDISCDAELQQLATFVAARPVDPLCAEPVRARIVVTPSVTIATRFAVSAWGASLTSDCFDFEALAPFLDNHYAKGPENFCSPGVDLDTIEAGSALYCPPTPLP